MANHVAASFSEAIAAIRSASIENLLSPVWLEHELLPYVGLIPAAAEYLPVHLHRFCGAGLHCFQSPNQMSRYLCYLAGQSIETYVELGVLSGGTLVLTIEYLSRFRPIRRAAAIDMALHPWLIEYAKANPIVELFEGRTDDKNIEAYLASVNWDLALIDADHSEGGCFSDYRRLVNSARRIAFHDTYNDICPGVGKVWDRLRAVYPSRMLLEFHEQYVEVLRTRNERMFGIGVLSLINA